MNIRTARVGSYSYSVVDVASGLEIAMVAGKRRRAAVLAHIAAASNFAEARAMAFEWLRANPRRAR